MSSLADDQTRLLRALTRFRVDFVVVGGVAAQLHGWRGATAHLDVAVAVDDANVERLNAALSAVGAGPPAVGALGTVFETRFGRLEIVRRADGVGEYDDWARRAAARSIESGLSVVVADPGDVVRSKEASGRQKDHDSLPQIRRDLVDAGALDEQAISGLVAPARERTARAAPPTFLVGLLGPRPRSALGRRWDIAAQAVLDYRSRWSIEAEGIGEPPSDHRQVSDRRKLDSLIQRTRNRPRS